MRIAIVSDIHGNRIAFDAVLADLRQTAPDLILHGGDLSHGGSSPVEIVDRMRDLGVVGNTDEMLFRPESLAEFARQLPALQPMFTVIEEMAVATRSALGEERLGWLRSLPREQAHGPIALVHASPEDLWRAPSPEASSEELKSVYGSLGRSIAVYAHIHRSFIRSVSEMTVVNTGSVSLSYDGDRRAAYLILDDLAPASGVWNTIWTKSSRIFPPAACLTRIGLQGASRVPVLKCRRGRASNDLAVLEFVLKGRDLYSCRNCAQKSAVLSR